MRSVVPSLMLLVVFIVCRPQDGSCALWTFTPGAEGSVVYNSNVMFGQGRTEDDIVAELGVTLDGSMKTQISGAAMSIAAASRQYLNNSSLNDKIGHASLSGEHRFSERFSGGGDLSFVRDSTMDSEFSQTGISVVRTPRNFYGAGLRFFYELDELAVAGAKVSHSRVQYRDFSNRDSSETLVMLEYSRRLHDETTRLRVRPTFTHIVSDISETKTSALLAGLLMARDETMDLHLDIGIRRSMVETEDLSEIFWGGLADIGFGRRFERGSIDAAFQRSISYGLWAVPIETDSLVIGQKYLLTPLFEEEFGTTFSQARRILSNSDSDYAKRAEATIKIAWLGLEDSRLVLGMSYDVYRSDKDDAETESAFRCWLSMEWVRHSDSALGGSSNGIRNFQ